MMENTEVHTLKEPLKLHRNAKPIDYSIDPATGCWNIVSHAPDSGLSKGYVHVTRNGRRMGAHRYSYELAYDPIPDELWVLHRCDNKECINPEHLFLGTQKDNLHDAAQKGRMAHGEAQGNSKLTETDVVAIRADKVSTQKALGEKYGVSLSQISVVRRGLSWKHIPILTEA